MFRKITLSFLAFSLMSSVSLAACGPRAMILKALKGEKYSEQVFATGKSESGLHIYEFFLNEETGSFTVLATVVISKDNGGGIAGRSCIVAGGNEFRLQEPQDAPKPTKHTRLNLPFYALQ